jgi:hypothetical protein
MSQTGEGQRAEQKRFEHLLSESRKLSPPLLISDFCEDAKEMLLCGRHGSAEAAVENHASHFP